ncbi:MAG: hypothetical protein ACLVIY_08675 [Anaerobutyricum soehngenii]
MKNETASNISADSTSAGDEEFSSFVNKAALEGMTKKSQQEKPETILAETLLLPEQVLLLAVTELPTLVR